MVVAVSGGMVAAVGNDRALNTGDVFPDFSLQRSDGSAWQLSAHAGHPKIVMFWATWCPYCKKLFPGIVALEGQYAAQGLEIVAVNFRDDGDTDAYAERHGLNFDVVLDGDALAAQIGVRGTPTVFVLDGDNRVRLRSSDSDPQNPQLWQAVGAAVAKSPVSSPVGDR